MSRSPGRRYDRLHSEVYSGSIRCGRSTNNAGSESSSPTCATLYCGCIASNNKLTQPTRPLSRPPPAWARTSPLVARSSDKKSGEPSECTVNFFQKYTSSWYLVVCTHVRRAENLAAYLIWSLWAIKQFVTTPCLANNLDIQEQRAVSSAVDSRLAAWYDKSKIAVQEAKCLSRSRGWR